MSQETAIIFENGMGLRFVAQDFGNAGIKFSMQDDTDIHAVLLCGSEINSLLDWLSKTTGRPIIGLPSGAKDVIESIVKDHRSVLSPNQKRVCKQMIDALRSLASEKTPTGKANSNHKRALNRS